MRAALLVVDMLQEFIFGKLGSDPARATVGPAKLVLSEFRARGLPVIYLCDSHLPQDPEIPLWGPHAMKGTPGASVVEELKPMPGETVLEKRAYSGFYGTPLEEVLRSLGVDSLVLVGLDADVCVRHTAADAFFRGYRLFVVRDAVAPLWDKSWEEYYRRVYGATVLSSGEVPGLLGPAESHPSRSGSTP